MKTYIVTADGPVKGKAKVAGELVDMNKTDLAAHVVGNIEIYEPASEKHGKLREQAERTLKLSEAAASGDSRALAEAEIEDLVAGLKAMEEAAYQKMDRVNELCAAFEIDPPVPPAPKGSDEAEKLKAESETLSKKAAEDRKAADEANAEAAEKLKAADAKLAEANQKLKDAEKLKAEAEKVADEKPAAKPATKDK